MLLRRAAGQLFGTLGALRLTICCLAEVQAGGQAQPQLLDLLAPPVHQQQQHQHQHQQGEGGARLSGEQAAVEPPPSRLVVSEGCPLRCCRGD